MTMTKTKAFAQKTKKVVAAIQEENLEVLPSDEDDHDSNFDDSTSFVVMPMMMTSTTTVENQISNLTKIVEGLAIHVQNQDVRIAKLMDMLEHISKNGSNTPK